MAGRWFRPGDGPTPAAPEGGRAGPPPQYSPDGRWFWNGERWIPSAAVLAGEPEPEPDPVPV
ncbi:MAG: signal recognition particle-docking protein FtsY, partial [Candidatus Dormibacteraeota bacterium]|nr:signal recognition particle-docking protein FtsY [Candidatus Dormibacteraeota bacterium]